VVKYIFRYLYLRIIFICRRIFGYPVVYSAVKTKSRTRKRALLVYLVKPFLIREGDKILNKHQNWRQNLDIAHVIAEMGYTVDVMNWNDLRHKPKYKYDLLVGMGIAAARMAETLPKETLKIYIATGAAPDFNNRQELERIEQIKRRRGCSLKPRRLAKFDPLKLKYFDAIACFGNKFTASTYLPYHCNIYTFNNYGYETIKYVHKDFETAKRSFLYFASSGQVHKGLDLLLEVFSQNQNLDLYICAPLFHERDFIHCYYDELFNTPNIHTIGWVKVESEAFYNVCKKCAYVILPSCAEGQVGSVVTCMHAGLIPIVSKECGIDTEDFGITLPNCDLETIHKFVNKLSTMAK